SCTTDCSAHAVHPKACCKTRSALRRVLISTNPCAPANRLIKASESLSTGVCLMVFCLICTLVRIGSNSLSWFNSTPMAAKEAQPVKCWVCFVIHSFMMMVLLSLNEQSTRGIGHHRSFYK